MSNSGVFRTVDVLSLYFGKSMSRDNRDVLTLLNYLLGIKNTEEFLLPYNFLKLQALLKEQLPWLTDVKLTYYDQPGNAIINFYEITASEIEKKQLWLDEIIKRYGKETKVRPFTDIEKAFLGYI